MQILAGLLCLGIAAYCISQMYDGFRTGEMPVLSRGSPLYFFRKYEPILFWSAALFNGFLALCMAGSVVIVVVREITGK